MYRPPLARVVGSQACQLLGPASLASPDSAPHRMLSALHGSWTARAPWASVPVYTTRMDTLFRERCIATPMCSWAAASLGATRRMPRMYTLCSPRRLLHTHSDLLHEKHTRVAAAAATASTDTKPTHRASSSTSSSAEASAHQQRPSHGTLSSPPVKSRARATRGGSIASPAAHGRSKSTRNNTTTNNNNRSSIAKRSSQRTNRTHDHHTSAAQTHSSVPAHVERMTHTHLTPVPPHETAMHAVPSSLPVFAPSPPHTTPRALVGQVCNEPHACSMEENDNDNEETTKAAAAAAAAAVAAAAQQRRDSGSSSGFSHTTVESGLGEAQQLERAAEVQSSIGEDDEDGVVSHQLDRVTSTTSTSTTNTDLPCHVSSASSLTNTETTTTPAARSLLDFESALNLRLATLTRQSGKAFRAVAAYVPSSRESADFAIVFEDIASGARLTCTLSAVRVDYMRWVAQFHAAYIALFVPTLNNINATLLSNAILHSRTRRPAPPPHGTEEDCTLNEEADHLIFSYVKLREVIARKKRDLDIQPQQLTLTILNAYAEEWKNYITTPLSCLPQSILLAAFNFHPQDNSMLNKELLHAQLSAAADALIYSSNHAAVLGAGGSSRRQLANMHHHSTSASSNSGGNSGVANSGVSGVMGKYVMDQPWALIFVSAPTRTAAGTGAIPPMQDLLTGQFVEPLTLSERRVIYIIGTGTAAESFAHFPVMRKGRLALSILLHDIEFQLRVQRPYRMTLTATLTHALDSFSRLTWMGLMREETCAQRMPNLPQMFYKLRRRTVAREIVPSFLEAVFAPCHRLVSSGPNNNNSSNSSSSNNMAISSDARRIVGGGSLPGSAQSASTSSSPAARGSRRLEEYIHMLYNNPTRFDNERRMREELLGCRVLLLDISTASVTAARRADNPFSRRNGVTAASWQMWPPRHIPSCGAEEGRCGLASSPSSSSVTAQPPMCERTGKTKPGAEGAAFVDVHTLLPEDLPTGPPNHPQPDARASRTILVAWDVKRVLLFLRESKRLRDFLYHGGRIWCAQYAQYLLKGFNHLNLATMERTLLQYHDGPLRGPMHPLAKLKLIYDVQLNMAVNTRQLRSIVHRMDGLLASAEMETQGLQLVPQVAVSRFADTLRLEHGRLEKVLQEKMMDFTKEMDDDVRKRINFRSPQDISTIIYGGALCRLLGSRFVPVRPTKYPITALFPHAACRVTGTPVPALYREPETLLGSFSGSSSAGRGMNCCRAEVERSIQRMEQCVRSLTMEQLVRHTAVVVVVCRTRLGGLLEQISLYCPAAPEEESSRSGSGTSSRNHSSAAELNLRVATDEILPVADDADIVTVSGLKKRIAEYKPLRHLLPARRNSSSSSSSATGSSRRGEGAACHNNLLILTHCTHDKLEPLVDTGVIAAIQQAVLGSPHSTSPSAGHGSGGKHHGHQMTNGDASSSSSSSLCGASSVPPTSRAEQQTSSSSSSNSSRNHSDCTERVCFADLLKAFPPPPQGPESFESDFSELTVIPTGCFSAKAHWEAQTRELAALGGLDGLMRALISHCASVLGSPRDALRSTHPLPSRAVCGLHGQEQASTAGMLWMVTPPSLHAGLRRFLKGRGASSGADAMERVTVFLSPHKNIDLSFFTALQQLRFTEKKIQLFEEGCLFRAVLPECNDRVHGELCHCVTATGRLSSQSPNLQNIPKEEDLRRLLISRFGARGRMIEADYSQLEVVVLAALSRDPRMMQELRDCVDFHCLRVSLMTKEPYEEVVHKVKVLKDSHYVQLRQQAKVFSFQRQYGAGVSTIATTTGLTEQEVDRLIAAEEQHYRELSRYYKLVLSCVEAGADRLLRLRTLDTALGSAYMRRVVMLTEPLYYHVVPTGSKFDFTKDRKSLPRLKNYPVQGLAGEIVQIMCGKIVRQFYEKRNYQERAFLVNTVHDCVWVDAHESVVDEVRADVARILGSTQQVISELWPEMKLDVPFKAEIHTGLSLGEMSS